MLSKSLKAILFLVAAAFMAFGITAAYAKQVPQIDQQIPETNAPALLPGPVYAQPIDPSGKLIQSSEQFPDGSDADQFVWDNFTLLTNQTLTEIDWFGGYDPAKSGIGGAVIDFTIAIYPSIAAGTEPAVAFPPLVKYQVGGNASETAIGMVGGITMYAYTFSLPVPFDATGGVKYWVNIIAQQGGSAPDWGLAAGTDGDGSHYHWFATSPGGDSIYRFIPGDAAFTLVGPLPNAPTDILLSNTTVDENQPANTVVGGLTATHPDPNATFTFSLACAVARADDGSFNILGTSLRTSAVFDFETKSAYNICVRVTDQGGLFFDKNFVVSVSNVNEAPTGLSLSANAVDENQPVNTVVGTLTATDPDAGATFTFSLACAVAGADDASFNILGTSLRTSAVFDFETKSAYNICIRVTDQGGLFFDKNFAVSVNNVNEAPTGLSLSANTVDENQPIDAVVGALTATDPDAGATFTFSLACAAAGADDASFNILGTSLRTSAVFDFEAKSAYNICVRVTDQGGLFFDKNFAVSVNDIFENAAPTDISLSNAAVDENQPIDTVVGALTAVDPDAGATFTFSLACAVAGADDASFNILGTDLRTSAVFDFETKSAYNICVRVTDQGGLFFDKNFAVSVNDIFENAAPTGISLSNAAVDENQPVNTVVGALIATDPDGGATFTFSLACAAAGADDGSFNVLGTSLRTSAVFDFEAKSAYNICIRVTDQGGLFFDKNFVVSVNNVNEAPANIFLPMIFLDENQSINTVVSPLSASDPDAGAMFIFSLSCAVPGSDDGFFNIQGTDLQTSAVFDFEAKSAYNICIRVTDQGGLSFDKNFAVSVNNVNEAPEDVLLYNAAVDENQLANTMVGALSAADPDAGATFTFSLACAVAGADDGSFNIMGTDLRTSEVFDFETKSAYNVCVRVTDQGGLTFDKNFAISVNDVNESANTPGKVTGGGVIGTDKVKDKITFGFTINYKNGDAAPKGNLIYQDHKNNFHLKVTSFDLLVIDGNHVWFTGSGVLDDGKTVSFRVEIDASSVTFYIYIPALDGYEAGGRLTGGNIKIH